MQDLQPDDLLPLVKAFYQKATTDSAIAHFFTHLDLEAHLPVIASFWQSVLFGSGPYRGNPMEVHHRLHEKHCMQPEHFERWLFLWEQTVLEGYTGPKADEAVMRAKTMGGLMRLKVVG
jgi:hemoglobin